MATLVRAALFWGDTFIKFVSGSPAQINANQTGLVDDWRVVDPGVRESTSVPPRGELPRHEDYIEP